MNPNEHNRDREFEERIISLDRVTRVVKGGRRFRFRATVVVGDGRGRVGVGIGKGRDTQSSIAKAVHAAKRAMVSVNLRGTTIPHDASVSFSGASVLLKPARPGTGVIAGGAVRSVLETAGVKDIRTKALGSSNKINNAYATIAALASLAAPVEAKAIVKSTAEKSSQPAAQAKSTTKSKATITKSTAKPKSQPKSAAKEQA